MFYLPVQVDFANRFIGGGVLGAGHVQVILHFWAQAVTDA